MTYKIWTEISGGVTGTRGAYMKANDEELTFKTRDEAQAYIDECIANHSPHRTFSQRYAIDEVQS